MTNGAKFHEIFPNIQTDEGELCVFVWIDHEAINISLDWWYAEYQEPTTKNDLGVDCISRQAVIDLMMQKWGENFSGDDAMQESIDAIRVMPSVTPQEPMVEIDLYSVIKQKYIEREVLDELRAEITTLQNRCYALTKGTMCAFCKYECEYKAETEQK